MRCSLIFSVAAYILFPGCFLLAQQLPFVHYTPKDGLVNNRARLAYQDSRGQMYFTTYGGLSVYDGSVFTNYTTDNGLASSLVNDVMEMGSDSLWVVPNADKVHCLVNGKLKDLVTVDGFYPVINKLVKASNGTLYALADGGLYKFTQNRFTRLDLKDAHGREINKYFTAGVEFDNKLFLITDNSVWKYPAPSRLIVYDIQTGKSIINQTKGGIYSIVVSPRKEVFVGTLYGLKLLDISELRQGRIGFAPLPSLYIVKEKLVPHYLYFDRQENLWLLSYNGIFKINKNGRIKLWTKANGLSTDFHCSIFQDRENIIWLMNLTTGISKLSNTGFELYSQVKPGFNTSDIYANPRNDTVWFLDREHKKLLIRHTNGENEFSLKHEPMAFRITGGEKKTYICGDSALFEFSLPDGSNIIYPRLVLSTVFSSTRVYGPMCLLTDQNGNPIVVNQSLSALVRNKIIEYPLADIADQFFITPDNRLWTITRSRKLYVFQLDENSKNYFTLLKIFEKELPTFSPRSITVGTPGNVWVGSRDNGLFWFSIDKDLNFVSWKQFTMKDGLSDNYISYLYSDNTGDIWACSPAGLDKVQLADTTILIENITRSHNLYQPVIKVQTAADGVKWILSTAGVIKLTPSENLSRQYRANIFLTSVQADHKSFLNSNLSPSIPYAENDMIFRMAAPSFIDEKHTRFSYLLEGGVSKKWSVPSVNPEIRFINLGPGKYTLRAKAIFLNGIYPETSTSYTFEILPPWWQTWWFLVLLSFVLAGISAIMVRSYFRRKLQKQQILFEKQQAIEKERSRIASDMHDDLGAGLSTIRFLSEKMKRNSLNEMAREDADKIVNNSNELVEKMNDIIWAMNEKNDSLEDLLFYCRSYAMEYCEDNNLECHVYLPDPIPDLFISGEIRRNVFLTVKESLHNIVKHASASVVVIRFDVDTYLVVSIIDNGKGMVENDKRTEGNGLLNMQKRVSSLNGSLTMRNGNGVIIEFRIPLKTRHNSRK